MFVKCAVALVLFCVTGCHAQANTQPTFMPQNITLQDEQAARKHKWANLRWTGENKPCQQIRQQMEAAKASGQDMEALRVKYGLLAEQHPQDPLAQFRWSYAAALSITPATGGGTAQGRMFGVAEAQARVPSPRTYDYLRQQFLIEVWYSRTKGLEKLGRRLLEHSPNDYSVQCAYVWVLHWSDLPNASEKALLLANQLIKHYLTKSKPRNILANIYTEKWWSTHNPNAAHKALAAFQDYLRLAPPTDAHRQEVVRLVADMTAEMASRGQALF